MGPRKHRDMWPRGDHDVRALSRIEQVYAYWRRVEEGVALYNLFNGPWASSTRREIATIVIALLVPTPVDLASDRAGALSRANES